MKKLLLLIISCFIIFSFNISDIRAEENDNFIVEFVDPDLEHVVRKKISKLEGDLLLSDVEKITSLSLNSVEISSLDGIEYLTSLTSLTMHSCEITEISKLANLTNLTYLYLYNNGISDLEPLSNLTNLDLLHLGINDIKDISPIAELTNLTRLYLYGNEISDISALENLTNLRYLNISSNNIYDISPLVENIKNGGFSSPTTAQYDIEINKNKIPLFSPSSQAYQDLEFIKNSGVDIKHDKFNTTTMSNETQIFLIVCLSLSGIAAVVGWYLNNKKTKYLTSLGVMLECNMKQIDTLVVEGSSNVGYKLNFNNEVRTIIDKVKNVLIIDKDGNSAHYSLMSDFSINENSVVINEGNKEILLEEVTMSKLSKYDDILN